MQGFTTNAKRGKMKTITVPMKTKSHSHPPTKAAKEENPVVEEDKKIEEKTTLKEQAKKFSTSTTKRERRILQEQIQQEINKILKERSIESMISQKIPASLNKKAVSKKLNQNLAFPKLEESPKKSPKKHKSEEQSRFEIEQVWYGAWKGSQDSEVVLGELQDGKVYLTVEPIAEKLILDDSFAESTIYLEPKFCPKSIVSTNITYSCQDGEEYRINTGQLLVEPTGRIRLFANSSLNPFKKGTIISLPYTTAFSYKA